MKSKTKIFTAFVIIGSLVLFSGCLRQSPPSYKVDLEIWGVFDNSEIYDKISAKFRLVNPHIGDIKYRKFVQETYKKDLLDALASGQGPDIFMVSNSWVPSFQDKVEPSPDRIFTEQEVKNDFVDVVSDDFLINHQLYGIPLSVDSLALYYNKDLFNAAGIVSPPATWDEFNKDVSRLTVVDNIGNIIKSGAAMGTAYNINRSTDILGLLMMQNGAQMVADDKTEVAFNKPVVVGGIPTNAAEKAMNSYIKFSNPSDRLLYSWNPRMHYSIDAFFEGTTAMMLNYSFQYSVVQAKNSKLNFGVAPVPQVSGGVMADYANYWGFAVAKNKIQPGVNNDVRIQEAWQFLKFFAAKNNGKMKLVNAVSFAQCSAQKTQADCITGNDKDVVFNYDAAENYLTETGKPAARRDIIEKQKSDVFLGPFATGNLIAKSWYQPDPTAVETILAEAIDSINKSTANAYSAVKLAAERINVTLRK
jgi:ABC-type glycerol-3-phosphate transport system substrate-binding protein